jgi:hypothetical protein
VRRLPAAVTATAVLVLLAGACQLKGEKRPYERLGPEAAELRAAFNAEAGRVRVVMLVEPT